MMVNCKIFGRYSYQQCLSCLCKASNQFDLLTELLGIHSDKVYTYKELRIATEDFSPANKIGEGGFGFVYKVTLVSIPTLWFSLISIFPLVQRNDIWKFYLMVRDGLRMGKLRP